MTATRETHDVTTVEHPAANGEFLTVADLRAFADEAELEGIPDETIVGVQGNPQTGRWVLVNAVTSQLADADRQFGKTEPEHEWPAVAHAGEVKEKK